MRNETIPIPDSIFISMACKKASSTQSEYYNFKDFYSSVKWKKSVTAFFLSRTFYTLLARTSRFQKSGSSLHQQK